ncbi:unnamed protein product [Acanthoscelides obtectus]|uniref:Agrin n=1 Tax=Acanthoscelides obtectus TaxID=200917 RepID=A0A9P0NR60_ACAOB
MPEHSESSDRRECIVNPSAPDEYRACASSPCREASTCVDLPGSTFACMCGPNFTGVFCEIEISGRFTTPAFYGRSYVRLKPLKAYYKLSVEIEFKSYNEDGILLYNQQKADGLGDYVSLAIIKGFVEFRYDLGSGPAVIRSLEKVETGKFHKIVIKRYHRDGMLKVDDGEDMGGQASGHSKALDLQEDTFIGYIPTNHSRIYENIGTDKGLQGCIRKLKLGRQEVGLNIHQSDWVLKTEGIYDCSQHACTATPCRNKGRCFEMGDLFTCACAPHYQGDVCEKTDDPCASNPCHYRSKCRPHLGSFLCDCLPGTFGKNCEIEYKNVGILTPEFNGSSYIQFPRLEGIKKTFSVEVSFMPKAPNGLIFYSGQMKNGKGDFVSLNLARGHLQFRFNLGSGIANITSRESLTLNKWHWVRVYREGREGILQVDNASIVRGYSGTPLTELNLQTPFFIGSLSNWKQIHRLSGATKGFKGAIQRVILNGHLLPISTSLPDCNLRTSFNSTGCGANIGYYDGLPCSMSKNPCQNNGVCIPDLEDFTCKCPSNFKGKYCEMVDEDNLALKFSGMTFLQYRNRGYRRRKPERGNRYELRIRTFITDGLLLWRSKNRNIAEDYLSVAIVDGYPEFSFNLGLRNTFWAIRSKIRVDDGEWHTIQVRRRKRVGFISVDGHPSIKGIARTGAISLRTNSKLWIGGTSVLPPGLPSAYYKGFDGCIKQILVNAKPLDLLANNDLSNIHFCHDNEI